MRKTTCEETPSLDRAWQKHNVLAACVAHSFYRHLMVSHLLASRYTPPTMTL
jgi:hypothetical protein